MLACGIPHVGPSSARETVVRAGEPSEGGEPLPPVLGVTITNPWVGATPAGASLRAALRALRSRTGRPPVARVVFDAGVDRVRPAYAVDARDYAEHVRALGADARIMGELLDSLAVREYSLADYRARACEYRAALGHLVDVWEVGNEVNGEWLGPDVIAKVAAAVEVFRADAARFAALCPGHAPRPDERPFELALTLYYNGEHDGGRSHCWARADHAMQRWVETHFGPGGDAAHLRGELDHVLVSYYEDDCHGLQPSWQEVFDRLGAVFTTSSLAIGECGTVHVARKARYAERYYRGMSSSDPAFANMRVSHPRYVGGFFWWYFSEDHDEPAVRSVLEAALDDPFWRR
ncbi:MAG TPA: hypothetical protein VIL20_15520 [Sandaracinaceae bacterium]